MTPKLLVTFFLVCNFCAICLAQRSTPVTEGKTSFEGMKKTKESFLRDQIFEHKNKPLDIEVIDKNVQLLKNIPGIEYAEYSLDTVGTVVDVTYKVKEISTLVPIINFGGIHGNIFFRLGITDYNWLGRGQFLSATYQNNHGLHSGHLFYKIPRRHNTAWGYTASASSWSSEEPLYFSEAIVDYVYQNNGIGASVIRHFGNTTTLEVGNTAFVELYNKVKAQPEENLPGPEQLTQQKLLSKIAFARNKVDYDYFYLKGSKWSLTYQNVFTNNEDFLFNSLQFEGQYYYRPTAKINFATRIKLGLSTNTDSPFAPFVADSHVNIRGVGNRISRGTAEAVINIEYRHTLSNHNSWASQFVAFTDIGSWRNPGGNITELIEKNQIRHFVGIGGRLIYKKLFGATIRVDYGVDIYNPEYRGLVLGLGQYF